MEDNERGGKKEKRCDAADVWETATPVSDQRCHRRPAPFATRSARGWLSSRADRWSSRQHLNMIAQPSY